MGLPVTYEDAINFLYGRLDLERVQHSRQRRTEFKLAPMRELLQRLGNPQQRIPAIHVAGTKGKGSTSAMIAAVLTAAGYRVGLFTSPHVEKLEERFVVNGELVDEQSLVSLVQTIVPHVEAMLSEAPDTRLTFFELITAIAWQRFSNAKVDVAVLEVGLGGRLDTTNVCNPLTTVITNISFDHTAILGDTLAEIAGEKAGIIKQGVPVISGVDADEARPVIQRISESHQSQLWQLGQEIDFRFAPATQPGSPVFGGQVDVQTPRRVWADIPVKLAGRHQAKNAALALAAIDSIEDSRFQVKTKHAIAGMESLNWPLRIEVVSNDPLIILDAAHNEASMRALADTLIEDYANRPRTLIFGTTTDKDVSAMIQVALDCFDHIILTCYSTNPRAVSVNELRQTAIAISDREFQVASDLATAHELALRQNPSDGLICVAGSFFLAAEMQALLTSKSAAATS